MGVFTAISDRTWAAITDDLHEDVETLPRLHSLIGL